MADIVILGMEMPKSCDECRLFNECWCMALGVENWRKSYNKPPDGERLDDCPLVPLPEKHGRLIDADALNLDYEVEMADDWKTAHEIANVVKYAPTIVPAEGGTDNGF